MTLPLVIGLVALTVVLSPPLVRVIDKKAGYPLAALLFGFATNMQYVLAILGTPVPSQFMAMLPYLVTVFAVAGLVGRSRGPAASGVPYVKE